MLQKFIKHYGTKRHSGRYPWGSGKDSEQRGKSFLGYIQALKDEGLSEVDIAKGMGMTTSQLRTRKSLAKSEERAALVAEVTRMKEKGMSNVAIGKRLRLNESSVRSLLDPTLQDKATVLAATTNMLRDAIEKKGLIDVGSGVETHIGISRTKLNTALEALQEEGYKLHYVKTEQLGTGKFTSIKVLSAPDVPYSEVFKNRDKIKTIQDFSEDGGRSFLGLEPIRSIDSNRIHIRYAEDGGSAKDGVIELRRGVDELSLGKSRYAQVRVGVDGTHYMKGMAMYTDDLPKGVDVIYNTKKPKGTDPKSVFKSMKEDQDNPFGSVVRQQHFITEEGKRIPGAADMLAKKQAGQSYKDIAKSMGVPEATVKRAVSVKALNIVNEEGDWTEWSRNISSQVLSKQSTSLAKKQLGLAKDLKTEEFEELTSLTNPAVKKRLLESFADDADSAAVHLKAAALPRQSNKVLLPITSMKENEIYAPTLNDGERVVLIRHPHGGTFEIPELVVNNRNPEANRVMKNAVDAVGIHPNVAKKLSGADFDGDTALVIPNGNRLVKTSPSLSSLKDFDPITHYPPHDGMRTIDGGVYHASTGKVEYPPNKKPSGRTKQMQMGDVSNLITDMTIKGASPNEIARAVRHSMVVIDSEKHHLNYKQSAIDNGIADLKKRYQGGPRAGASTLVSRASSQQRVLARKEGKLVTDPTTGKTRRVYIDPKTGQKLYEETGETFVNRKGQTVRKTTLSTKMAEVRDAFKLSSGTDIENIYAEHANSLKDLANKARLLAAHTKPLVYSPTAKKTYAPEVASLKAKLNIAYRNKPLERQAQLLANKIVSAKRQANPDMDAADLKKIKGQALEEARHRTGAKKQSIVITDKEWHAIQLGAVSNNTLTQILHNTDVDSLKVRATPRTKLLMTPAKTNQAKAMIDRGYTLSEVASALGVSVTTLQTGIK